MKAGKYVKKDDRLYEAILTLETVEECYNFFVDLCTESELKALEQRFEVALLLDSGMVYSEISEKTGASSATISRVNRFMNYGPGGYKTVIKRIKK